MTVTAFLIEMHQENGKSRHFNSQYCVNFARINEDSRDNSQKIKE